MELSDKSVLKSFRELQFTPIIEAMYCDGTLIAFRFARVADTASKGNKIHVKRIGFAFGDNPRHQFMRFFRSTI